MMSELEAVSNTVDRNNQPSFILDRRKWKSAEVSIPPSKIFHFKVI